jgi:LuxR family maltose regulon positive regulatory protein
VLLWIAHLGNTLSGRPDAPLPGELTLTPPPPIVDVALRAAADRARRSTALPLRNAPVPSEWSALATEMISAALAAGQAPVARRLLEAIPAPAAADIPLAAVERRMLISWLASLEGDQPRSHAAMRDALAVAETQTLIAVFLRGGPGVIRIIATLPGPRDEFRSRVLERATASASSASHSSPLSEQLTDREREILAFLPTRLTNVEIGAQCFVSLNTIKTHMAHIYRKLDVPNRNAAVTRAMELGLLP